MMYYCFLIILFSIGLYYIIFYYKIQKGIPFCNNLFSSYSISLTALYVGLTIVNNKSLELEKYTRIIYLSCWGVIIFFCVCINFYKRKKNYYAYICNISMEDLLELICIILKRNNLTYEIINSEIYLNEEYASIRLIQHKYSTKVVFSNYKQIKNFNKLFENINDELKYSKKVTNTYKNIFDLFTGILIIAVTVYFLITSIIS